MRSLEFNGLIHYPMGDAELSIKDNQLHVSNISKSGFDGVQIDTNYSKVWDLKMSEVSLLKGDSINFRFLGMDMENRTKVNGELALTEVNGQIQLVVNSWLLPKTVRIIGQNKGEEVFSEIINVPESPDANWWPIALGLLALVSAHYESVTVSNSDGSSTTTSSWGVDIGGAAKIQIPNGITFYGDFIKLQFDRNYKAGDEYSIAKVNQVEINGSLLNSIIIEEEKHDS